MLQIEFLNQLKNDLNEGHLEKAIESLIYLLENKDKVLHKALLIQRDRLNGINSENAILEKARVKTALEFIIDEIEKNPSLFLKYEKCELLIDKKVFLEKELITTYDSEKKFALQLQINELERQISELKNRNAEHAEKR